jgi:hypothetical protein
MTYYYNENNRQIDSEYWAFSYAGPYVNGIPATGPITVTVLGSISVHFNGASLVLDNDGYDLTVNGIVSAILPAGSFDIFATGVSFVSPSPSVLSTVNVGSTGTVFGNECGLYSHHAINLTNAGRIGGRTAIELGASYNLSGSTISNSGLIESTNGTDAIKAYSGASLSINNTGEIRGGIFGGSAISYSGSTTLTNSGTITGNIAFLYGASQITNLTQGVIGGSVTLAGASDSFTNNGWVKGTIDLSGGNDSFVGGAFDDTVIGGAGADAINGGGGNNTSSYAGSAVGVTVSLAIGAAAQISAGDASGDSLTNIQNLTGSDQNDTLTGDANANILKGGAGSDTLTGGLGNDIFLFNISDLSAGQTDTITDFTHDSVGVGDTIRLVGVNSINVSVAASGANAVISYGNGVINDTITAQAAGTNPVYLFGYASEANALSGNKANGFLFVSDAMNEASHTWSKYIQFFDGNGETDYQNTTNDDSTRAYLNLDNLGNEVWANFTENYSANNALMNRTVIYDDNSQYRTYLDHQANQPWAQYVESLDSQGRLDYRAVTNDNGSLYVTHLDRFGNQPWSQYVETFDPQGRLDYRVTTNDNGSLYVTHNDHNNNLSWSTYIDIYDTQSRNTFEQFNYDNGTRDDITIDALNQQSWARDVYSYSAANVLTQHYHVMDDGSIVVL